MIISDEWASINSLWPSATIWPRRSGSILAEVMAWWHQANTWTNFEFYFSYVRFCDSHLRAALQWMCLLLFHIICLNIQKKSTVTSPRDQWVNSLVPGRCGSKFLAPSHYLNQCWQDPSHCKTSPGLRNKVLFLHCMTWQIKQKKKKLMFTYCL